MRKKIPTITRPDPSYAASLRPESEDGQKGEKAEPAATSLEPVSVKDAVAEKDRAPQRRPAASASQPSQESVTGIARPLPASPPRIRRIPMMRKIDIRVNALERQEEALIDCGIDPAHVIRAALRRAVKNWQLRSDFVPPSEEQRTRITAWQARTSLAVDADSLKTLLHIQDPLDVLSKWALIRGQIEPRVWSEIDAILEERAESVGESASNANSAAADETPSP